MDNFSEENLDFETEKQDPNLDNIQDITFEDSSSEFSSEDELISDDELSAKLESELSEVNFALISQKEENAVEDSTEKANAPKKYVIYVEPENIEFIESLSLDERREVINKVLTEQKTVSEEEKEYRKNKKLITNAIVAAVSFLIAVPVIFNLANAGLQVSITNYSKARDNFAKLYREQGKIRPESSDSYKKIKY